MDSRPKTPHIFANKVIKILIESMLADDFKIKSEDYQAIRVVFRKLDGSWDQLGLGSLEELEKLKKVITGWSKIPHDKKSDAMI